VVALFAGLLAVTTAHTAQGTTLRSEQTDVAGSVRAAQSKVESADTKLRQLQAQVVSRTNAGVAVIAAASKSLQAPTGLTDVSGPGLDVTLDDSHTVQLDPNVNPDDLVVHQWDMQAVVNALWAGGAEAMTLMGQRLIATSAVRCVGPTLLLNGEVFSPPFKISAIGPVDGMRAALDNSANVMAYRQAVKSYGLEYDLEDKSAISMAGYDAPIGMTYAKAGK
jgi:uncharacterized protein YlxW (UPF0749 family)